MPRIDGRQNEELRPVRITPGVLAFAEGSALVEMGLTRVLCSVSLEERLPPHLERGGGKGWVTAEYGMLPRSTPQRTQREAVPRGRAQEIQRLIGRALRAVTDPKRLGEVTLVVDCDVLQADGGTRCAAITGGYVALYQALRSMVRGGLIPSLPLKGAIAAVSVGLVAGEPMLDLCYEEDSRAEVDFNVVMTDKRELIEVQGTAETRPFSRESLDRLLSLAEKGITELLQVQKAAIANLR